MKPTSRLPFDRRPRILIVDDERQNRQLLEVMLQPEGFLITTAASGEEALARVAEEAPDLILLDVMMPGMDGYQVAGRLKGNLTTKNIPVIMVTALGDRKAKMLGLKAGAEEFLSKPVDRAELVVRVRNLSRLKASGDDRYDQMIEGEVGSRTDALLLRTKTLEQQAAVLTEQAALLDLAPDAIVVRDLQGHILFWSRGAEEMYGWPSEEALGRNAHDLLRTEYATPLEEAEATVLRQGRWEGEAIHHRRDGTRVAVASRWALQRGPDGAPIRMLTIDNDISGRRLADAERRLLTDRLSLATAVAKVGVWEWDRASNSLTWDATMFDIYGLPPVVPMPYAKWSAAVHPEDLPAVEAIRRRAIFDKGEATTEFRIGRPDGSVRNIAAVERVVVNERGKASRIIGVNIDVTERKEAEKALAQTRKDEMRFKDAFLSHVSHELRSPLTAIKQFTSILLGGSAGALNDEQREYQQIVLRNIRQLQSMIDDLLEVTSLETGKLTVEPASVSVSNAVTDTFNTLQGSARAKGITLSFDLAPDLPSAYADPTRLRQMLIILLDNAVKFTPKGGAVTLQVGLWGHDPRFLLFAVADTGCGISQEMTERIFERLYQVSERIETSRKGLGLGLYICKELVARQGGDIWVTRGPQQGTTFSFTLPVCFLNGSIAPLLKHDQWPAESVALVIAETCLPGGWPSRESQEGWSREVRSLLQHCSYPDLDALLPTRSFDMKGERFFLAAFANDAGASVLAGRIRGQFQYLLPQGPPGITLSVSYRMLPPVPRDADASADVIVTRMATRLEAAIESHLFPAVVHHE
jgi:PAS domain S-box-containing protein